MTRKKKGQKEEDKGKRRGMLFRREGEELNRKMITMTMMMIMATVF
jgi:hypothetical protein